MAAAGGTPCPQATQQPQAETYATGGPGDERAVNSPPVPTYEEQTEGPAYDTDLREPTAVEQRVHLDTTMDTAH